MSALLEAKHLTRLIGTVRVVDNVSLALNAGEILGLLGPNGSGKTTLLKMLLGLVWPSSGVAIINGQPVPLREDRHARMVGCQIEEPSPMPHMTGAEHLRMLALTSGLPDNQATQARIEQVARRAGAHEVLSRRTGTYSLGQRQRLGIAGVLVNNPEILILDEPTNALDPASRQDFWRLLEELRQEGKAIVVSTHILEDVQACTHLAVMNKGRLMVTGETESLLAEMKHATIQELFDAFTDSNSKQPESDEIPVSPSAAYQEVNNQ